ncbi:MAG: VWA domain-containing protein [Leptospiraceae bacterium]|nr:VWA domain-containing protein [Leptospiraceae bacterium]
MITYEYSEFFPEDDNELNTDKLMSVLSDMIMKYNISLEEALRMLIDRGLPVNLFLKEGGMESLVENFRNQIQEMMEDILKKYKIYPVSENISKEMKIFTESIVKKWKKNPDIKNKLPKIMETENQDELRRLRWDLNKEKEISKVLSDLLADFEDKSKIENADKKYNFTGNEVPTRKETLKLIKTLEELKNLEQALSEAMANGDLYNIDLEKLARYLGPESYQEFLEKRESIFEKLKELLEKNGNIVQNESDGGIELSPKSIRKLGSTVLAEIFSKLRADSGSGSHATKEYGDSENITSVTRPLEFGDNVSNIDFSSSIINSLLRGNGTKPSLRDIEVYETRGTAKSSTVILLDMSGSMARSFRFYNAKKVTLALDSLIRREYKDDKLTIIGFGTMAKIFSIPQIPTLEPYSVTIYDPHIRLRFDFSKMTKDQIETRVPLYFTNLQKGLSMARQVLSSKQIKNKQIILITDGAPTAHFKGNYLHVNYPPTPADFDTALDEVKFCAEDGVIINTFLLTSEWDFNYFGEKSFIQQFAKISKGRIFYPHPNELNQMILYDFVSNKKKKFAY